MATDFLEQLAQMDVPAVPEHFDRQLHQRMNRSLLAQQLLDLAASGLPWAAAHFLRALLGAVIFSVTGQYPDDKPRREHESL
jgi:hypothetical protein